MKIAVVGAGHLGKIHLSLLKEMPEWDLVGLYDIDQVQAKQVADALGIQSFNSIEDLIQAVDAVDIVTPTTSHFEIAKKALIRMKHVFIEKPITQTLEEADKLLKMLNEAQVVGQVGHVERFNPAFLAAMELDLQPMFIEVHRLAPWNPRGTEVPVVLDLMIHDIDLIQHIVKSGIKRISASGVAVISDTPDIANARIEFLNGCVANLTTSRISMKKMRKMRLFQKNAYIGIDLLDKQLEVIEISEDPQSAEDPRHRATFESNSVQKHLLVDAPEINQVNSIGLELKSFYESITQNKPVAVSFEDGFAALRTAFQVLEKMGV